MTVCSGVRVHDEIPRQNGFRWEYHFVRGHFSPPRLFWRVFYLSFEPIFPADRALAGKIQA
jgi:hypothetical protein